MMNQTSTLFMVIFMAMLFLAAGRPYLRERRSGISDQRLAELETLVNISKLRSSVYGLVPAVAFGAFDPARLGKKRRSNKIPKLMHRLKAPTSQSYTSKNYIKKE
ncbi:uncharacterized protein LOC111086554 [Limulus polyphemus]|uniref:Uncharacterized protein LOC111086554 n=1 Tax=Limulus polyphemus TaxID=6850 RepID=A0ABM1SPE8_LIMPO|nr:uncharacterized protein LOC111086554 [Limulus polyphemus]